MMLLAQPALRGGREDEQNSSFLPGAISSSRHRLPVQMEEERAPAAGAGSGRARRCGFVVWLHGLGDSGRANEFIAEHFSAAAFRDTRWAFPTAPTAAVTCNRRCYQCRNADGFVSLALLARRR